MLTEQEMLVLANRSMREDNLSTMEQELLDAYKDDMLKEGRIFAWDRETVSIIDIPGVKTHYKFSELFIAQVVSLAKEIAYHVRGVRELQTTVVLIEKYEHEQEELDSSEHPEEEWPDLVYYACCLAARGNRVYLSQLENELEYSGLSQTQVQAVTLAKYRLRASGPNSKDFEAERKAIRAAL